MIFWEDVINPVFLATIRGEVYSLMTDQQIASEIYELTRKGINSFKFPRVSLTYGTYYKNEDDRVIKNADGEYKKYSELNEDQLETGSVYGYFVDDNVGDAEIAVIVAWMFYHWANNNIINADNFTQMYTDSNITGYSPANAIDKYIKFLTTYKANAKETEQDYYRSDNGVSTLGEINDDD